MPIDLDGRPTSTTSLGAPVHAEIHARTAKPIVWIVVDRIAEGGQYVIAGLPKRSKKSLLVMWLATRVASGEPFLGHPCFQRPVIYTGIEDGDARIARRLEAMGAATPCWRAGMFQVNWGLEGYQWTMDAIRDGFKGLWIVDPMIEVISKMPGFDENDSTCVTRFLADHRDYVQRHKSSILWTDHFRKAGDQKRGSIAKDAAIDGWADVIPARGNKHLVKLTWSMRDGDGGEDVCEVTKPNGVFQFVQGDAAAFGDDDVGAGGEGGGPRGRRPRGPSKEQQVKDRVRQILAETGGASKFEILAALAKADKVAGRPETSVRLLAAVLSELSTTDAKAAYDHATDKYVSTEKPVEV